MNDSDDKWKRLAELNRADKGSGESSSPQPIGTGATEREAKEQGLQLARASVVAPILALLISSLGLRLVEDKANVGAASSMAFVIMASIVVLFTLGFVFATIGFMRGVKRGHFATIAWSGIGFLLNCVMAFPWVLSLVDSVLALLSHLISP